MSRFIHREAVIYSVGDNRLPLLSSWKPSASPLPPQNPLTFPSSLLGDKQNISNWFVKVSLYYQFIMLVSF